MGRPLWEVAHLGDVVENLQGPIDLDALFDAHSSGSCAPNTFSAAMMPPDEVWHAAATLYSPKCCGKRCGGRGMCPVKCVSLLVQSQTLLLPKLPSALAARL